MEKVGVALTVRRTFCIVLQAADGKTNKRTPRCTKILPAGALQIKWPQDIEFDEEESFVWSILNPCNFNKDVHLGWRFAASELKRIGAAAMNNDLAEERPRAKRRKEA